MIFFADLAKCKTQWRGSPRFCSIAIYLRNIQLERRVVFSSEQSLCLAVSRRPGRLSHQPSGYSSQTSGLSDTCSHGMHRQKDFASFQPLQTNQYSKPFRFILNQTLPDQRGEELMALILKTPGDPCVSYAPSLNDFLGKSFPFFNDPLFVVGLCRSDRCAFNECWKLVKVTCVLDSCDCVCCQGEREEEHQPGGQDLPQVLRADQQSRLIIVSIRCLPTPLQRRLHMPPLCLLIG